MNIDLHPIYLYMYKSAQMINCYEKWNNLAMSHHGPFYSNPGVWEQALLIASLANTVLDDT